MAAESVPKQKETRRKISGNGFGVQGGSDGTTFEKDKINKSSSVCKCVMIEDDEKRKSLLGYDFKAIAKTGAEILVCGDESESVAVRDLPSGRIVGRVWPGCGDQLTFISSDDFPWIKVSGHYFNFDNDKVTHAEGFIYYSYLQLK